MKDYKKYWDSSFVSENMFSTHFSIRFMRNRKCHISGAKEILSKYVFMSEIGLFVVKIELLTLL